jgi:hypothetical protein
MMLAHLKRTGHSSHAAHFSSYFFPLIPPNSTSLFCIFEDEHPIGFDSPQVVLLLQDGNEEDDRKT